MGSIKVIELAGIKMGFWNRWDIRKHVQLTEILMAGGMVAKHELQRTLGLSNRMELDGMIAEVNVLALHITKHQAILEADENCHAFMVRSNGRQVQAVVWNEKVKGKVYTL